jgi:glycosyltransferase involved in cell wall biosynthesis
VRVSVICTVLNEGQAVRRLLNSLAGQTRAADEIVVVDGGSVDDTVAIIREYAARLPLRVLVQPGANISQGRNCAIAAATGEIIASTDAGVWLEATWLERLTEPFGRAEVGVVAGFFVADPATPFETAMGATVLPALDDIDPAGFLPSSRSVAFRKSAWSAAGGYPEWLDYCEDLIFDFRLRDRCGPFAWAPDAIAHFRPRPTLASFSRQYYRYARGDGKADLWRMRHLVRYATYMVALPLLLLLGRHRPLLALGGLLAGSAVYCRAPYRRLGRSLPAMGPTARLKAFLLVPLIRVVGDIAKMLGYPAGWAWRLKNWHVPEIHWLTKGG